MKNNLEQILNCLREANAEGMIVDTIWMDDDQTLFDFIELCIEEAALTQQQEAEPVAEVGKGQILQWAPPYKRCPEGTKLYARPPRPAAQPVPRSDTLIVEQTESIAAILANAFHGSVLRDGLSYRDSHNPKAMQCWRVACDIQEALTNTDVENAVAEHDDAPAALPQVPEGIAEKYNELLYHVARKFPNESRHETALRYIKNAESAESYCAAAKEEGK